MDEVNDIQLTKKTIFTQVKPVLLGQDGQDAVLITPESCTANTQCFTNNGKEKFNFKLIPHCTIIPDLAVTPDL